jgi:accessory gene regulator B
MFSRLSERITDNLVKQGTVDRDEREVYLFGVQQGMFTLFNIATTVAVGLMLDVLWQILIFTVALIALKSYAGGYHAKTPLRCYFLSTMLTISVSFLIRYVVLHTFVYAGLLILAGTIIIVLSPIDSENKPLDDAEKKIYRKRAVAITATQIFAAIVLLYFNLQSVAVCIVWNLVAVSLMMIMGRLFNRPKYDVY